MAPSDAAKERERDDQADAGRLYEKGKQVADEARIFVSVVEEAIGDAERYLKTQLATRPYLTLAVAAGAGYVLGGGVPSRLTRLALDVGARLAIASVVQGVVAIAKSDDSGPEPEASPPRPKPRKEKET